MARHSIEFLREAMGRTALAGRLEMCTNVMRDNPGACFTTNDNSQVQIRVGEGKRTWVSMRVLLWLHTRNGDEVPEFSKPKCDTKGCINPDHQQPREEAKPYVNVIAAE